MPPWLFVQDSQARATMVKSWEGLDDSEIAAISPIFSGAALAAALVAELELGDVEPVAVVGDDGAVALELLPQLHNAISEAATTPTIP
jgi:hypothetical protein